jgi:hypothetical protein
MQARDGNRSLRFAFRGRFRAHLAKFDVFDWSHESETNSVATIGQMKLMINCYRFDKQTKHLNRCRIIFLMCEERPPLFTTLHIRRAKSPGAGGNEPAATAPQLSTGRLAITTEMSADVLGLFYAPFPPLQPRSNASCRRLFAATAPCCGGRPEFGECTRFHTGKG